MLSNSNYLTFIKDAKYNLVSICLRGKKIFLIIRSHVFDKLGVPKANTDLCKLGIIDLIFV